MIWRLRLMTMGWPWRRIAVVAAAVVVAGALGVTALFAFVVEGGDEAAPTTTAEEPQPPGDQVFYLQAVAPRTKARGCRMQITFVWKPHYRALQYVGETAVIQVTGSDIAGTYRRPFSRNGVSLGPVPVSLAGGYRTWSAKVTSVGNDTPGNDTTVQAAPPTDNKCL